MTLSQNTFKRVAVHTIAQHDSPTTPHCDPQRSRRWLRPIYPRLRPASRRASSWLVERIAHRDARPGRKPTMPSPPHGGHGRLLGYAPMHQGHPQRLLPARSRAAASRAWCVILPFRLHTTTAAAAVSRLSLSELCCFCTTLIALLLLLLPLLSTLAYLLLSSLCRQIYLSIPPSPLRSTHPLPRFPIAIETIELDSSHS